MFINKHYSTCTNITDAPLVLGCTINQNKNLHELIEFKDPIECQWSNPADKLTTPVL